MQSYQVIEPTIIAVYDTDKIFYFLFDNFLKSGFLNLRSYHI